MYKRGSDDCIYTVCYNSVPRRVVRLFHIVGTRVSYDSSRLVCGLLCSLSIIGLSIIKPHTHRAGFDSIFLVNLEPIQLKQWAA